MVCFCFFLCLLFICFAQFKIFSYVYAGYFPQQHHTNRPIIIMNTCRFSTCVLEDFLLLWVLMDAWEVLKLVQKISARLTICDALLPVILQLADILGAQGFFFQILQSRMQPIFLEVWIQDFHMHPLVLRKFISFSYLEHKFNDWVSSGNDQETETCMVWVYHTRRQPFKNYPSGHIGGWGHHIWQKKCWMDNAKEQTSLPHWNCSQWISEDWKIISVESSLQPNQLITWLTCPDLGA